MVLGLLLVAATGCAGVRSEEDGTSMTASSAVDKASHAAAPVPSDKIRLVISTGFGADVLRDVLVDFEDETDVMEVLAAQAEVKTAYGGGFVNAIDGIESTFGATGEPRDWFYWVAGRMGQVGAADQRLTGGETIWWDHHAWQGSGFMPVVLQAFPQPWKDSSLAMLAEAEADAVAAWATAQGLTVDAARPLSPLPSDPALVVVTAAELQEDTWLSRLLDRGAQAGIFVAVDGPTLLALDHAGTPQGELDAAVLGAPHPEDAGATLLVFVGRDAQAISTLIERLDGGIPGDYVAMGLRGDELVRLPQQAGGDD
jgi:hypothetical protein